jgi:L-2-hydroxyglutarate oxidase LhgO
MMAGITFVVYDPPTEGLPFLAVAITPDGEVSAVAYPTAYEAELHNSRNVADAAERDRKK